MQHGDRGEAAKVLDAVKTPSIMLNWIRQRRCHRRDCVSRWLHLLPKDRIGHCHCKDAVKKADNEYDWAPMGGGVIDWAGQFKALKRDGYHFAVSLKRIGAARVRRKHRHARAGPG